GVVVWHDPWLNWDFQNMTGQTVNDFAIIVDSSNFSPDSTDPGEVMLGDPFSTFQVTHADYDNDGDTDTKLKWIAKDGTEDLPAGGWMHGGLWMKGSGPVLDAYWTWNCSKVGGSTEITYEQTEIRGDPEVHMHLNIAPGFFADPENASHPTAGWENVRTFVNIPADLLGLQDINDDLDLGTLSAYEVFPRKDGPTGPLLSTLDLTGQTDATPLDVFLAEIDAAYASPDYEALLYAQVINPDKSVIGEFWNLNPQSPEPATLALLGLGAVATLIRRRRSR
ncbi:MAG: PEP-CTERM sorting domain-containing protein, partial [Phycisphaerae bacterium]